MQLLEHEKEGEERQRMRIEEVVHPFPGPIEVAVSQRRFEVTSMQCVG